MVELSAGPAGLRVVLITLDETGQPVSAGDTVLHREEPSDPAGAVRYRTESIGGRLEPDGAFRGTRWRTIAAEAEEGESRVVESTPSEPSEEEVTKLRALVAEVLRRAQR